MRHFLLWEFICGGGCYEDPEIDAPAGSLLHEGRLMMQAMIKELLEIPDSRLRLPLDSRMAEKEGDFLDQLKLEDYHTERITLIWISGKDHLRQILDSELQACDYSLLIAPEIHEALTRYSGIFERGRAVLLGPSSDVIQICADKWKTFMHLVRHEIHTLPTLKLMDWKGRHFGDDCVVKPRMGAGSIGVRRVDCSGSHPFLKKEMEKSSDYLLQPRTDGVSASIGVICDSINHRRKYYPSVQQVFAPQTYDYVRCEGPLEDSLDRRARCLMEQVLDSLPPFSGYLGVDLLLGNSEDFVVDINPRWTTSYCQTREWVHWNALASLVHAREQQKLKND